MTKVAIALSLLVLSACSLQTSFSGSPKVPNGAKGCRTLCEKQGLEMAGMVFLGQYSDGCVCQVPGKTIAPAEIGAAMAPAAAAVLRDMQLAAAETAARKRP